MTTFSSCTNCQFVELTNIPFWTTRSSLYLVRFSLTPCSSVQSSEYQRLCRQTPPGTAQSPFSRQTSLVGLGTASQFPGSWLLPHSAARGVAPSPLPGSPALETPPSSSWPQRGGPRPPVTFHSTHTHFLGQLESHVLARCRRRRCWQVGRPLAARKSVLFSYLPIFFLGLVYFASFVIVEILQQCGSIWLGHFCSDNILNPVICHLVLRSFFFLYYLFH